MPWDDDDLREWLEFNLGYSKREEEALAVLEAREWKKYQTGVKPKNIEGGDPSSYQRCVICTLPTAPRFVKFQGVCHRCRDENAKKNEIEKKLKHYFWLLKEIRRLRKIAKQFEEENPEIMSVLSDRRHRD